MTTGRPFYKRHMEEWEPPEYDAKVNSRIYAPAAIYDLHLLYEDDRFTKKEEDDESDLEAAVDIWDSDWPRWVQVKINDC